MQVKDAIINGVCRVLGKVYSPEFVGKLTGNADTATSATKATQDESGNNIKSSYASSISISDHTITLKNKNGSSLGTVTVPDNNTDTKVTQTVTTSNASYPLLLAPNGQTATATTTSYFDSGVTLNPSTNTIAANISGSSASCTGNAATATKATQDSAGQQINTTYIKGLSASGKTVTYTKGDGTTGTVNVIPTPNDIGALPIIDFTGANNDLDTLIQSGVHCGFYQVDADTLNTPYKAGLTSLTTALVLSFARSSNFAVQYAFVSGQLEGLTYIRSMTSGTINNWSTGCLPLTGGTLSGRLSIQPGTDRAQVQFGDSSGVSNHKIHAYSNDAVSEIALEANRDGTNNNRTTFSVRSNHDGTVPTNAIRFTNYVDGTGTSYNMYGEHNKDSIVLGTTIKMTPEKETTRSTVVMRLYADSDASTNYGDILLVGAAGDVYVGAGESATAYYGVIGRTGSENLYLSADDKITLASNCNTIANRKEVTISAAGAMVVPANTDYTTYKTRNIGANTTAMTAGKSSLANGYIYLQYQ